MAAQRLFDNRVIDFGVLLTHLDQCRFNQQQHRRVGLREGVALPPRHLQLYYLGGLRSRLLGSLSHGSLNLLL